MHISVTQPSSESVRTRPRNIVEPGGRRSESLHTVGPKLVVDGAKPHVQFTWVQMRSLRDYDN